MPSGARLEPDRTVPASPSIWIIVPTYNECENVGPISGPSSRPCPANVLFVDDGSPDAPASSPISWPGSTRTSPCCTDRPTGTGTGLRGRLPRRACSRADVVVQIDADFSHPVRFLPRYSSLWQPIGGPSAGFPLRQGRAHPALEPSAAPGEQGRQPVRRDRPADALSDLTGGYKAFRGSVLRAIDLDRLHAGGYAFQIETTFQARLAAPHRRDSDHLRRAARRPVKMSMAIFTEAFRLVLALRIKTRTAGDAPCPLDRHENGRSNPPPQRVSLSSPSVCAARGQHLSWPRRSPRNVDKRVGTLTGAARFVGCPEGPRNTERLDRFSDRRTMRGRGSFGRSMSVTIPSPAARRCATSAGRLAPATFNGRQAPIGTSDKRGYVRSQYLTLRWRPLYTHVRRERAV